MSNVVVDTSVIIDHLRKRSDHFIQLEHERTKGIVHLLIPHIVITELHVGKEANNSAGRKILDESYKKLTIVGLTETSAKIAGELIRTYQQVPDPYDLLIAAIAIEQDALIATHNTKHFSVIKGIKLYDFENRE